MNLQRISNRTMLKIIHNVTVFNEEVTEIPEGITIIATGPLTSEPF